MLEFTYAQLNGWTVGILFPLARMLGLFSVAPFWGNRAVSARLRLAVGAVVAFAVLPALPPMPDIEAGSFPGILILAQQVVLGIAAGLLMRVMFAAFELAGEMIAMQMGLSFAVFFNPQTGSQSPVMGDFLSLVVLMIFLSLDGHLMLVKVLVASFTWMPVGTFPTDGWMVVARHIGGVFSMGVLIAMPIVSSLLLANISLGVLTRAAPQLNLFAIGFPITLTVGFVMVLVSLTYFAAIAEHIFEMGFNNIEAFMAHVK